MGRQKTRRSNRVSKRHVRLSCWLRIRHLPSSKSSGRGLSCRGSKPRRMQEIRLPHTAPPLPNQQRRFTTAVYRETENFCNTLLDLPRQRPPLTTPSAAPEQRFERELLRLIALATFVFQVYFALGYMHLHRNAPISMILLWKRLW